MSSELSSLREQLCTDAANFCRECFAGSPYQRVQNPPNVFRAGKSLHAKIFFIFDKPNDNDGYSGPVPITIFDSRLSFGFQPSQNNLLVLLAKLGLGSSAQDADPLESEEVHITNAVKCDKCALTGKTGRVAIGEHQAKHCISRFLFRELAIIRPIALMFFGEAAQRNVLGYSTPLWKPQLATIADRTCGAMRVPHTSPTPFNTYGGRGENYKEPFRRLMLICPL